MASYEHEIIHDNTRLQLVFQLTESNNDYSPLHWHGHLEILFMLEGYMTAYINDRKFTLKKDDMLIIGHRELHSTKTWGEVRYMMLQIPYDYLARVLDYVSLIQFQEYFPSITMNSTQKKLRDCLLLLKKDYTEQEDGYLLHFSSVVYEFLYILYRNHSKRILLKTKEKENRNFARIEDTIQFVKANYRKDISLTDASNLLNISPEYFCRLFKKHTGQTFLEYVNAVRMLNFYHDLMQTDYSITELLEKNGITNYKVFIRTFKDIYHTTPNKLRMEENAKTSK